MEGMKQFPDKYFELAIVDPPYGIGESGSKNHTRGKLAKSKDYKAFDGDDLKPPDDEYFLQLMRVSKNQIIWGGNYFELPPTRGIISWDKNLGSPHNFSHFELAWTSFDCIARRIVLSSNNQNRFHPTQKPVALYKWLLTNYAKEGDLILDTHVGSASSLIACHDMGFDAVGFELDADYYKTSKQRLDDFMAQPRLDEAINEKRSQIQIELSKDNLTKEVERC